MYWINIVFLSCEIVIGIGVMTRFSDTQSAAFFRRTAPLIDKRFRKKYKAIENQGAATKRDIQIGVKKQSKTAENDNAFESSEPADAN